MQVISRVFVTGLLLGALSLSASAAHANDIIVDDDRVQCPDADFTTIQAAVTFAATVPDLQKIRICEGTYPENVTIGSGNSLDIFGDGVDKVFVTGMPATSGPIFDVTSAGHVTIEKLTVDGMSALAGGVVWGIRYTDTNGRIKDAAVLNIRNASGSSQGLAIRVQTTTASGSATVHVEDNQVENYTRVGINGNGTGVEIHVEDNNIVGPVLPKVWAPNGVQVSRGAIGTVKGNQIFDATSPNPPAGAGSGIILFCAGKTSADGNKIFNSDVGIAVTDNRDARLIGNEATGSVFDAYSIQSGLNTFFGGGLGCPGTSQPTINNHLEGNKAFDNGENGVSLVSFAAGDLPDGNRVYNTDIKTSGLDGIHIFDGMDNRIVNNTMEVSGEHDAHDDTIGTQTAGTANHWIDNTCKTPPPNKENTPGLCKP